MSLRHSRTSDRATSARHDRVHDHAHDRVHDRAHAHDVCRHGVCHRRHGEHRELPDV